MRSSSLIALAALALPMVTSAATLGVSAGDAVQAPRLPRHNNFNFGGSKKFRGKFGNTRGKKKPGFGAGGGQVEVPQEAGEVEAPQEGGDVEVPQEGGDVEIPQEDEDVEVPQDVEGN